MSSLPDMTEMQIRRYARHIVLAEVGGIAHVTGEAKFRFDDDDPLREGFSLGV